MTKALTTPMLGIVNVMRKLLASVRGYIKLFKFHANAAQNLFKLEPISPIETLS